MTIALTCCVLLTLICILAAVVNDKRTTRLTRATKAGFDASQANDVILRNSINALTKTTNDLAYVSHRERSRREELEVKVVGLEGRELRRIYAENLASGMFKTVKRPRAHKVTTRRRNGR